MQNIPVEPQAVDLAIQFEGFSDIPYKDPIGIWTIGYGSIYDWRLPGPPRVILDTPSVDKDTAKVWMGYELKKAAFFIQGLVKVDLTDGEIAALEDLIFNIGIGNFKSSMLLKYLNTFQYELAAVEFDKWDHAGGTVLAGLLRRRQAETDLFNSKVNQQINSPTIV